MSKHGWTYKKLGDLTTTINGLWTGKKPPFVNVAVVRNTNFTKDCKLDMTNVAFLNVEQNQYVTRKLYPGDIIVEKSGGSDKQPVGRPVLFNISDGEYSFSNFTSTLRISTNEISSTFLHKVLFAKYLQGVTCKMQSKTTGIRNLNFKAYKSLEIPVPPMGEQEAIVAELDEINSAIDELKLQVADLGTLAQATFYDMFGDPVANPKAWPVKKLGEIAQTGTGATPNRRKSKLYYGGTIPWVKTTEVHYDDIFDTEEKITDLAIKETNCKIYPPGTILLAMYGQGKTRGQIAKVKISASTNQACAAIELFNSNCNIDFIYEQLKLKYSQIRSMARGGNQANLNLRLVKSIEIILPPMPLQQEFAARVKAIEGAKAELKAQMADMQALLASRMQYWFD